MAFIESLGRQTISIFHQLGAIILLLIATVKEIGTIRSRETFKQCLSLGVLSFPIVALTLFIYGHGTFGTDCRGAYEIWG